LVVDGGNPLNVRQCGAEVDYTVAKGDAGSTDDSASIQAALNFAGASIGLIVGNGGLNGSKVISPPGWSLVASPLNEPEGVSWIGAGQWSSGLKFADTLPASQHAITVCDS
jgi:hypothetical protein